MLFAGQYEVKLERRKRISLPKFFIKSLEKQTFKGLFFFPSLNGKCIEACGEAWLAYWSRKMDEQGSILNKNEVLISNILDSMSPCEVDKAGRITLPMELAESYEVLSPLMITGRGFRFQIWKKDEFLAYREQMKSRKNELFLATGLDKTATEQPQQMEQAIEKDKSVKQDNKPVLPKNTGNVSAKKRQKR